MCLRAVLVRDLDFEFGVSWACWCKCKITFSSRRVEAFERMFTAYYRCNDDYLRKKKKKCDEKFHRKNVFTQFAHSKSVTKSRSCESKKRRRDDKGRPGQFSYP